MNNKEEKEPNNIYKVCEDLYKLNQQLEFSLKKEMLNSEE